MVKVPSLSDCISSEDCRKAEVLRWILHRSEDRNMTLFLLRNSFKVSKRDQCLSYTCFYWYLKNLCCFITDCSLKIQEPNGIILPLGTARSKSGELAGQNRRTILLVGFYHLPPSHCKQRDEELIVYSNSMTRSFLPCRKSLPKLFFSSRLSFCSDIRKAKGPGRHGTKILKDDESTYPLFRFSTVCMGLERNSSRSNQIGQ